MKMFIIDRCDVYYTARVSFVYHYKSVYSTKYQFSVISVHLFTSSSNCTFLGILESLEMANLAFDRI